MGEQRNPARGATEWQDTYGSLGNVAPAQLMQLPLHILDPWTDITGETQPFRPYTPAMLQDLARNICKNGVIQPIHVRPKPTGRFEIIAGHNRVEASKLAGLSAIPALVQQLDDNQAAIIMIDSNLKTRPYLLPSEKAKAYKLRMEKLSRQGHRTDLTSAPLEQKLTSRDMIAAELGVSHAQVQRYIRLTFLHPALLDMVDNGSLDKEQQDKNIPTMALRAGVELSYLPIEQQDLLLQVMEDERSKAPSMSQAELLRQLSAANELDEAAIRGIMVKVKAVKPVTVNIPAQRIAAFFPSGTTPEQMEAEIYEALLAYRNNQTPASA